MGQLTDGLEQGFSTVGYLLDMDIMIHNSSKNEVATK